jgi:hypothetical protein
MLKKLLYIANNFLSQDKSLISSNNYVITLMITKDGFVIEKNNDKKNKIDTLITPAKRTSGISPLLGNDQIKYVFPNFSKDHNDQYMEMLNAFCSETKNSYLLRLQATLNNIITIINTDNLLLEPTQIEQKNIINDVGKHSPGGFVNIKIDQDSITNHIFSIWKTYQENILFSTSKEQSCSVCTRHNKISNKIPKPLNEFYSSNNKCSQQYNNINSSICVDCAFKINSILKGMFTKYLLMGKGAAKTTYIIRHLFTSEENDHEIADVDNFKPHVEDLFRRRELYRRPENIEYMVVSENNQGRSTYFSMDVIENIYQFFDEQEQYLKKDATNYFSINDLANFYIVTQGNFKDREIARKIFFRYAISKQLKKKSWLIIKLINQVERWHKQNKQININKMYVILNTLGVKMSQDISVITMGKLLANMSRIQKAKKVKKTFIERHAHRCVNDPQHIGNVIAEFVKKYGSEHKITVDGWEKDIKDLPSRKLTNEEILAFHVAIETEFERLYSHAINKKLEDKEVR